MRQGKKEQLLRQGADLAQQGRGAKGVLPWAGDSEFGAEPGSRPVYERSGNPRVHKS